MHCRYELCNQHGIYLMDDGQCGDARLRPCATQQCRCACQASLQLLDSHELIHCQIYTASVVSG